MKRSHHSTGQTYAADVEYSLWRRKRIKRPSESKSEDVPSSTQSDLCSAENELTPSSAAGSLSSREGSKENDLDVGNDDTVSSNGVDESSFCSILFRGKTYRGELKFEGDPRGRSTKVYSADIEDETRLVIKDTYRRRDCLFREEDLLRHTIHGDSDVPEFVRMHACEYVNVDSDGEALHGKNEDDLRIQLRLALYDYGERLLKARSINDFLRAIYDALEVHRTIYVQRRVLHRDMSAYNILMYPHWAKIKDRKVLESAPPLIRDILDGLRPLEERVAECLMIDTDNAADLDSTQKDGELAHRTGTPMFIARSVCAGEYHPNFGRPVPMPELHSEAYNLYIKAHGQERYDRYAEKSDATRTFHGGIPPDYLSNLDPPFSHRPEHDVESVAWTMLWVLLRVRPETYDGEKKWTSDHAASIWSSFHSHDIKDNPLDMEDRRQMVFSILPKNWPKYFPPEMVDVAILLYSIFQQVAPEYAYWSTQPPEEHLHEAVQRLILQYLVDHRDKDIKLNPDKLRPTKPAPPKEKYKTMKTTTQTQTSGGTKKQGKTSGGGAGSQTKNASKSKATTVRGSKSKPPAVVGSSSRSRRTGERTSAGPSAPMVVNPKRKSQTQGSRQSKRLKGMSGQPIDEEDEEQHQD